MLKQWCDHWDETPLEITLFKASVFHRALLCGYLFSCVSLMSSLWSDRVSWILTPQFTKVAKLNERKQRDASSSSNIQPIHPSFWKGKAVFIWNCDVRWETQISVLICLYRHVSCDKPDFTFQLLCHVYIFSFTSWEVATVLATCATWSSVIVVQNTTWCTG